MILLVYDCDLKLQIQELRLLYPIIYLLLTITAAYFFIIAGSNPGIVGRTVEGWQDMEESIEMIHIDSIMDGYSGRDSELDDVNLYQVHEYQEYVKKSIDDNEEDDEEAF
jgi:hypothetical protein